jgi:hypothetical protein
MTLRRLAVALAAAALAAAPASAAFDDAPWGARDAAMGGAFEAGHDGIEALSYNPAALGQAPALEAAASYQNGTHSPAGQIDRDSTRAGVVVPMRQDILDGAFGFDVRYDRRANLAKDREIGIYYGTRGLRETEAGGLDFGAGLKTLQSSLDAGGSAGPKAALDLGTLYRFQDRYAFGASLLNFGGASFKHGGYFDRAPLTLKLGGSDSLDGALLTVDGTVREPSSGQARSVSFAAGFERWWPTLRAGSFAARSGASVGNLNRTWSWGFGWRNGGARVDYAMIVPLSGIARFGHALTFSVRFGRFDPEAEYASLLQGEMTQRRELARALDAGAVKQRALAEEIGRLRDEISSLRESLAQKKMSEEEARRRVKDLEARQRKASEEFERLKDKRAHDAARTKTELFREDWAAYQRAKLAGAPDAALRERVRRLLVQYKDTGVDLGEANREFSRLQKAP